MADSKKRIAVFGITADPLTIAHVEIVKTLAESGDYDKVVVVPTMVNVHRVDKRPVLEIDERESLVKSALERLFEMAPELKFKVDLWTTEYDKIRLLQEDPVFIGQRRYLHVLGNIVLYYGRENVFTTVVGSDELAEFKHWHQYKTILRFGNLAVIDRGWLDEALLSDYSGSKVYKISGSMSKVSASDVRRRFDDNPRRIMRDYSGELLAAVTGLFMRYEVIKSTPIFDLVQMPQESSGLKPVALRSNDWVTVIVRDVSGCLLTVRQKRYGLQKEFTEFVTGIVDDGESAMDAAFRELKEEAGIVVKAGEPGGFVCLGKMAANPAIMTNYMHYFYVDLSKCEYEEVAQSPDEHEKLYLLWMGEVDLRNLLEKANGPSLMGCAFWLMDRQGKSKAY